MWMIFIVLCLQHNVLLIIYDLTVHSRNHDIQSSVEWLICVYCTWLHHSTLSLATRTLKWRTCPHAADGKVGLAEEVRITKHVLVLHDEAQQCHVGVDDVKLARLVPDRVDAVIHPNAGLVFVVRVVRRADDLDLYERTRDSAPSFRQVPSPENLKWQRHSEGILALHCTNHQSYANQRISTIASSVFIVTAIGWKYVCVLLFENLLS